MLDTIFYLHGTICAIGSLYIAMCILIFVRDLPFLDHEED